MTLLFYKDIGALVCSSFPNVLSGFEYGEYYSSGSSR